MTTKTLFSRKAAIYARYRWDYAPPAIQTVFDMAHLSAASVVADIGAGTGILTRHFIGRVSHVFAVEPDAEMRRWVGQAEAGSASSSVVDGCAEATTLVDHSVDLITVGHAIHWFDPAPARAEFARILKPGGWLAVLCNYGTDERLNEALAGLATAENGVDPVRTMAIPEPKPLSFWYGHDDFSRLAFPFMLYESWEEFIGALTSASHMPDADHPLYGRLEKAARAVYDQFAIDGRLAVPGETELHIGQPVF